jgi:hypothetical protein
MRTRAAIQRVLQSLPPACRGSSPLLHALVLSVERRRVPCISRFLGIEIFMWFNDHSPPHFHVKCGSIDVRVRIADGIVMEGGLPPSRRRLVRRWAQRYKRELEENWFRARGGFGLRAIPPLE